MLMFLSAPQSQAPSAPFPGHLLEGLGEFLAIYFFCEEGCEWLISFLFPLLNSQDPLKVDGKGLCNLQDLLLSGECEFSGWGSLIHPVMDTVEKGLELAEPGGKAQ